MVEIDLRNETKVGLLRALKTYTEQAVQDLILPAKEQSRDKKTPDSRAAAVYLTRLPDMASYQKKAPFILHQVVTGTDRLVNINRGSGMDIRRDIISRAVIRTVFCVYYPDEQEGGLALLNLMEAMRIALSLFPTIDRVFELDMSEGIEQMVYPETGERGTAPFYLGEMVTTWKLPPLKRLNAERVIHGLPPTDPAAVHYVRKL